MGQYYKLTALKKNWKTAKKPVKMALSSYDFDNGAKLLEFSYAGNGYVNPMLFLLHTKCKGLPFVCVGDYADAKITKAYPNVNGDGEGTLDLYYEAREYADKDNNREYAALLDELQGHTEDEFDYAFNLSRKEYIKLPKFKAGVWQLQPLTLLCADGNGRGGGDYRMRNDIALVGLWAYSRIYVGNDIKEFDENEDMSKYKLIKPKFKLDW